MRFLTIVLYLESAPAADLRVPTIRLEAKTGNLDPPESGRMLLQA